MPRTLSATLTGSIFPYTTLFGSSGRRRQVGHLGLDRQGRPGPRAVALAIRRRAHGRGEQVEASAQAPRRSFRRVGLEVEVELVVEAEALEGALELECRSEEHTSELQSLMRISYAVFCLKKKNTNHR